MRTLSLFVAIVLLALFTTNITLAGDTAPVMVEATALIDPYSLYVVDIGSARCILVTNEEKGISVGECFANARGIASVSEITALSGNFSALTITLDLIGMPDAFSCLIVLPKTSGEPLFTCSVNL